MSNEIPYARQIINAGKEAERLYGLGYRQVSRTHRIVARVDVPDWIPPSVKKHERWSAEEHWRRCNSKDWIERVDEDVMKELRKLTTLEWEEERGCHCRYLVCRDNVGIEDRFETGIEYVELQSREDKIWMFDKFGKVRECRTSQFCM